MSKTLGLATTRTFPCFPQSNCIYKQQIKKLHRSLFNFLPQRSRKLSTCPHVLNFFGTCTIISPPQVRQVCFVRMRVEINWIPYSFQKSRPAFFKTTLFFTIYKKNNSNCCYSTLRFACHFPLQFRKTIGGQSEAGNQIGDLLHAEEFKKKKKNMHPIKNSLLLVKNVSSSSTDPKSTDVPPSL